MEKVSERAIKSAAKGFKLRHLYKWERPLSQAIKFGGGGKGVTSSIRDKILPYKFLAGQAWRLHKP